MLSELSIKNAPAIPGLIFRPFKGDEDFPGMVAALNASDATDGNERVATLEDLANTYRHFNNCNLATDLAIVEVNGAVIGYGRVEWRTN